MVRTMLERGWDDRLVRVSKERLLSKLKENRQKHMADYQEALDGHVELTRQNLTKQFEEAKDRLNKNFHRLIESVEKFDPNNPDHIKKLRSNVVLLSQVSFDLVVPENHTKDYDVAIQMTEWSEDETIEITQSQLQCFIMDDWEWKTGFTQTMEFYKSRV